LARTAVIGVLSDVLPGEKFALSRTLAAVSMPLVVVLLHIIIKQYRAADAT